MPKLQRHIEKYPSSTVRRAIVIAVEVPETSPAETARSLAELEQLLLALGIPVASRFVQKRPTRTSPTYLGEGKLREIAALTGGPGEIARTREPPAPASSVPGSDAGFVVVVDDELSPGQQRNLEVATGVDVLDRTAVILRVFAARARTSESVLEVELARLTYELPRIRDDRSLGDREGGGGRAARGHTNVELAKQRARDRTAAVRHQLEQLRAGSETRRRARAEIFRVALVGYTNAGKSSVMRLLTGSDVLVEDKLFATLDTTVRKLMPPSTPPIVVADTVGFIHRLPHTLVASFRSTLEETREAWLLLHVVDAADPDFRHQIRVTEQVLAETGAATTQSWLLLNKVDRLEPAERERLEVEFPRAILMSAINLADGASLRERIVTFFGQYLLEERLDIPYAHLGTLAEMRAYAQVVSEEYGDAITVTLRATPEVLRRLKKLAVEKR